MAVFLVILFVGYVYVWLKGDLDWDKPKPEIPVIKRTVAATVKIDSVGVFPDDEDMME